MQILWHLRISSGFRAQLPGARVHFQRLIGLWRQVFWMPQGADWYWSWFDILCVILALVDMTLQFAFSDAEGGDETWSEHSGHIFLLVR